MYSEKELGEGEKSYKVLSTVPDMFHILRAYWLIISKPCVHPSIYLCNHSFIYFSEYLLSTYDVASTKILT